MCGGNRHKIAAKSQLSHLTAYPSSLHVHKSSGNPPKEFSQTQEVKVMGFQSSMYLTPREKKVSSEPLALLKAFWDMQGAWFVASGAGLPVQQPSLAGVNEAAEERNINPQPWVA